MYGIDRVVVLGLLISGHVLGIQVINTQQWDNYINKNYKNMPETKTTNNHKQS